MHQKGTERTNKRLGGEQRGERASHRSRAVEHRRWPLEAGVKRGKRESAGATTTFSTYEAEFKKQQRNENDKICRRKGWCNAAQKTNAGAITPRAVEAWGGTQSWGETVVGSIVKSPGK